MKEFFRGSLANADNLMIGCALAIWEPRLRRHTGLLKKLSVFLALAILTFSGPLIISHLRPAQLLVTVHEGVIGLFVYAAVQRADWVLNNRVASVIGVLSYSLYLWQQPFLDKHSHHFWNAFPVNMLLGSTCALAAYFLIEKPFLSLRTRREADARLSQGASTALRPRPAPSLPERQAQAP